MSLILVKMAGNARKIGSSFIVIAITQILRVKFAKFRFTSQLVNITDSWGCRRVLYVCWIPREKDTLTLHSVT